MSSQDIKDRTISSDMAAICHWKIDEVFVKHRTLHKNMRNMDY